MSPGGLEAFWGVQLGDGSVMDSDSSQSVVVFVSESASFQLTR